MEFVMFDIKVYDENGERETIRDLSWVQMTTIQQVLSRLHFLLGKGKHFTKQISDDSIGDILKERIAELEAQLITTNTALILSYQGRNVPSNIRDIIEENRAMVKREASANPA